MNKLKDYDQLYRMYCASVRKFKLPFFVCLLLFVLAFATFMVDGFPFGLTMLMMFMILPAILFGILWLLSAIRTKKQFRAFTAPQLKRINDELPSCKTCEGLFVTSEAVVGSKIGLQFVPMNTILWVYPVVTRTKMYSFLTVHKDTVLIFAGKDHKQQGYYIKNKGDAFVFIQSELLKHRLDIVFGYERGMDDIYKNDINRLIAFSQECAEKRREERKGTETR